MSISALIELLEDEGLFLWEDGGRLHCLYDGGVVPDTLREQVARHRQDLVRHLAAEDGRLMLRGLAQAYWLGEDPAFTNSTPAVLHLVYTGVLPSLGRLQAALDRLVLQHPVLACRLDGVEPALMLHPPCRPRVLEAKAEPGRPADRCASLPAPLRVLQGRRSDEPLFQLVIVDDGHTRSLHALFRMVLFDAPSIHIFMRDLCGHLLAPEGRVPLRRATGDGPGNATEKRRASEERLAARKYWTRQLERLPPAPSLPLLRPDSFAGRRLEAGGDAGPTPVRTFIEHRHGLSADEYAGLATQAQRHGVGVNAVLLTAYLDVLARWSAEKSVCVSAMISRRIRADGVDDWSIGNQGGLLLIGLDGEAAPFAARARAVQADLAAGLAHRAYDGVEVMRRWAARHDSRRTNGDPPQPFVFSSLVGVPLPGLAWAQSDHRLQTPQIWIDAQAYEDRGGLWVTWDELEGVFEPGVIEQAFATFGHTVTALARDAEAWQADELTLPAQVLERVDATNATAVALETGTLCAGLLPLAADADTAQLPAAICGERSLSFHELACKASQLAAHLNENGVGPSDNVVIRGSKSLDTVIAIYGTLLAGATYIPVTRDTPVRRVHEINRQAGATTVLGEDDDDIAEVCSSPVMWSLNYARFLQELPPDGDFVTPCYPIPPTQLAYIMFTSGSTGTPKGVAVTHAAAMNTLQDCRMRFAIGPQDRLLALSQLNFDLSVFDLFMPAIAGCAVVLPAVARDTAERTDPGRWLEAAAQCGATIWNSVPALMDLAVAHAHAARQQLPASLRLWMASGDWIPLTLPERLRALLPGARFVSLGGATEAAIWSNTYEVNQVQPQWSSIPYGTPMSNQRFHVLDRWGRRCPPLVTGMLHIAGDGLAAGYINDPQRTAASFFVDERLKERLYRTGDLGRYGQDGVIELIGRADEQVKIRGFRVELAEVEKVLGEHPGVAQAAVIAVARGPAARLIAFVVPTAGAADQAPAKVAARDLAAYAAQRLNAYMVPSQWLQLKTLPLTANGKVDKRRLRELAEDAAGSHPLRAGLLACASQEPAGADTLDMQDDVTCTAPRQEALEQMVQGIASGLLAAPVRPTDNWFDLGCTSLQSVYLLHALNENLSVALTLTDIYRHPSARALASLLVEGSSGTPNLVRLQGTAPPDRPLLVLAHPVGGSVACYLPLADRLRHHCRIVAFCADTASRFETVDAMADNYLGQLQGSLEGTHGVLFAGWSMGGVLAAELARQASASGLRNCAAVTFDALIPATPGAQVDDAELDASFDAELEGAALPERHRAERLAIFKANYRTLLRHRYQAPSVPILHGVATRQLGAPGLLPLASVVDRQACVELAGDHFSIMSAQALPQLIELVERGLGMLGAAGDALAAPRAGPHNAMPVPTPVFD